LIPKIRTSPACDCGAISSSEKALRTNGDERPRDMLKILTISSTFLTPEDEARMRAKLDQLGPEEVRSRLARTTTLDPLEAVPIDDEPPPWPTRQFVEDWLCEQRVAADRLQTSIRRWTITAAVAGIVAALAAIIAAWPVVKEFIANPASSRRWAHLPTRSRPGLLASAAAVALVASCLYFLSLRGPELSRESWAAIVGAIAGAVIGGVISALLQWQAHGLALKQREADRLERRQALAQAVLFKMSTIYSNLEQLRRHVRECVTRAESTGLELWETMLPLANTPDRVNFSTDELSVIFFCKTTSCLIRCGRWTGGTIVSSTCTADTTASGRDWYRRLKQRDMVRPGMLISSAQEVKVYARSRRVSPARASQIQSYAAWCSGAWKLRCGLS
jgi:hypothetical protein